MKPRHLDGGYEFITVCSRLDRLIIFQNFLFRIWENCSGTNQQKSVSTYLISIQTKHLIPRFP